MAASWEVAHVVHRKAPETFAEEHALTVYDASDLELAERTGGFLITEDTALLAASRSHLGVDRGLDIAQAIHHVQDDML